MALGVLRHFVGDGQTSMRDSAQPRSPLRVRTRDIRHRGRGKGRRARAAAAAEAEIPAELEAEAHAAAIVPASSPRRRGRRGRPKGEACASVRLLGSAGACTATVFGAGGGAAWASCDGRSPPRSLLGNLEEAGGLGGRARRECSELVYRGAPCEGSFAALRARPQIAHLPLLKAGWRRSASTPAAVRTFTMRRRVSMTSRRSPCLAVARSAISRQLAPQMRVAGPA